MKLEVFFDLLFKLYSRRRLLSSFLSWLVNQGLSSLEKRLSFSGQYSFNLSSTIFCKISDFLFTEFSDKTRSQVSFSIQDLNRDIPECVKGLTFTSLYDRAGMLFKVSTGRMTTIRWSAAVPSQSGSESSGGRQRGVW